MLVINEIGDRSPSGLRLPHLLVQLVQPVKERVRPPWVGGRCIPLENEVAITALANCGLVRLPHEPIIPPAAPAPLASGAPGGCFEHLAGLEDGGLVLASAPPAMEHDKVPLVSNDSSVGVVKREPSAIERGVVPVGPENLPSSTPALQRQAPLVVRCQTPVGQSIHADPRTARLLRGDGNVRGAPRQRDRSEEREYPTGHWTHEHTHWTRRARRGSNAW